ncbi:MAG TPA: sulfite exporter TauE/SafE family protein [Solirubrobacteraceae bacterium]|nr:sulfite exporter TauE/SafE family protein [Solirubrobacteraceae bacterium]
MVSGRSARAPEGRAPSGRALKLAVIGTAAGVFSGLFGVGGGTVMVPLLVLWLAYDERPATGTSLAAIIAIASFAAAVQALYGNVKVLDGLLVGIPGMGGVLAGTWLQQRLPSRAIALLFSVLLVATAVQLVLQ